MVIKKHYTKGALIFILSRQTALSHAKKMQNNLRILFYYVIFKSAGVHALGGKKDITFN